MNPSSRIHIGASIFFVLICALPVHPQSLRDLDKSKGEIEAIANSLRQAFISGQVIPIDVGSRESTAADEISHAPVDDQTDLRVRFFALEEAGAAYQELQGLLPSGPPDDAARAKIAGQVRKVAELLNRPEARGVHPEIKVEPLILLYTDPARWTTTAISEPRLSVPLSPLLEQSRQIQQQLENGGDPSAVAGQLGQLMDGLLRRSDLSDAMRTGNYREIIATADQALGALQSSKTATPEQLLRINGQRSSLDQRLDAIMNKEISVPSPDIGGKPRDSSFPSMLDDLTLAFHAAMRGIFPDTANTIWNHFFPPEKADSDTVARYANAIHQAAPEFQKEFSKVPDKDFLFVGGFDLTYLKRLGLVPEDSKGDATRSVSYGAATQDRLVSLQGKYDQFVFLPFVKDKIRVNAGDSLGITPSFMNHTAERLTLATLRTMGMMQNAKSGQMIVPKHFPGGPPELELTEGQTVSIPGGTKELMPYLAPFLAVLHLHPAPPALMIGHAVYPDWEKELSGRWPDLKPMYGPLVPPPASLSPLILRGFLRKGLHYQGLLIADWMDMGAIREYVNSIKPYLPKDCKDFSVETLIMILGTRAGLNWMPGLTIDRTLDTPRVNIREILDYYKSNQEFAKQFDELVAETSRLRHMDIPKDNDAAEEMASKLHLLTHGPHGNDQNWTDVWSRGGLMILSLRISILNHLPGNEGLHIPNLTDERRKVSGPAAEDQWVKDLNNFQYDHKSFKSIYNAVDWDSPEMRQAFLNAFQSISPADSPVPMG